MTRVQNIVALAQGPILAAIIFSSSAKAEAIRYDVLPQEFSDGTAIEGGFITTDGTLGRIYSEHITGYEIKVTGGSVPYKFSPKNPGQSVLIKGVVEARENELVVPRDVDPSDAFNLFSILAADNSISPNCVDCIQGVSWANSFQIFQDAPNDQFSRSVYFADDEDLTTDVIGAGTSWEIDTTEMVAVATRGVPEPSSYVIVLWAVVAARSFGRKRIKANGVDV